MRRASLLIALLSFLAIGVAIIIVTAGGTSAPDAPARARKPARTASAPAPSAPRTATADRAPKPPRPALPPAPRTVEDVVRGIGSIARARFQPVCLRKNIPWPPARIVLLAFKREKLLEVWGAAATGSYRRLATYWILASGGHAGPKRREGDRQVPEGFYRLTELNPNSDFHLSIRIDYPNATDIEHSTLERGAMGGDIYIHGNRVSIGCLALGDNAIEELFPMVAQTPPGARRIVIAPFDFRRHPRDPYPREEPWVHELYDSINRELAALPVEK
jgi:hypothetical protein